MSVVPLRATVDNSRTSDTRRTGAAISAGAVVEVLVGLGVKTSRAMNRLLLLLLLLMLLMVVVVVVVPWRRVRRGRDVAVGRQV